MKKHSAGIRIVRLSCDYRLTVQKNQRNNFRNACFLQKGATFQCILLRNYRVTIVRKAEILFYIATMKIDVLRNRLIT